MLDRLLNATIILLIANIIWQPVMRLGEIDGWPLNPVNLLIAFGVLTLLFDFADYQRTPKPRAVLIGAAISPFWLFIRRFLRR